MGLKNFLFGSSNQIMDNPEFGNFSEYTNALQRGGLYANENPDMLRQYFGSKAGQTELKKMGYSNVEDYMRDVGGYSPNVANSSQYGDIAGQFGDIFNQLGGMGNDLTDYGSDFNFTNQDISNVPDEAYQGMLDMQNEQASRGFKGALKQLGAQYGGRGFRPGSGLEHAQGTGLGRSYLEQLSNISRDVGMQKANARLDNSKFMSQQDLQRQQLQQQGNMQRANYLTQLQNYARNFGLQGAQTRMGALESQQGALNNQTTAAMLPYNTAYNYWDRTAINQNPAPKGGNLGGILKTGAKIGSSFL